MGWIRQFVLILVIKFASPANITTTDAPHKHEDLKTSSAYQVTENIIDIPDNRTLSPIVPNFNLVIPLNYGNNTLINNTVENNGENSEENNNKENINETNQNEGKLKKHSFSILHIKAEYDNKPIEHHQNVFSKAFVGLKEYVYNLKKGVVDSLHSIFHKNNGDKDKSKESDESEFQDKPSKHDKFHRNFHGVEDFGEDDYDDELEEYFGHF